MEMQQKLAIRSSIIMICGFIFMYQLTNCKESNGKENLGYGKTFFNQYCSACHGKNDGFNNAPSLLALNNYDSLTLLKKLRGIKKDSLHNSCLKSVKYSNKEITSIEKYIKDYFELHY